MPPPPPKLKRTGGLSSFLENCQSNSVVYDKLCVCILNFPACTSCSPYGGEGNARSKPETELENMMEKIKNREPRVWEKSDDDDIRWFLNLCVDLCQLQKAKFGLIRYKALTDRSKPSVFKNVVKYLMMLCEIKCGEAEDKAAIQAKMQLNATPGPQNL